MGSTHPPKDTFSQTENELGLQDIQFTEFINILRSAAVDRQIILEELGQAFKGQKFGGQILSSSGDSVVLQLLTNPRFKAGDKTLDVLHVFSIGFLYCKGDVEEKVKEMFDMYDFNQNGNLQSDKVRIILDDVIQVAGTIIPAIEQNIDQKESEKFTEEASQKVGDKCMSLIFQHGDNITREEMEEALDKRATSLNNSVLLRKELSIKWDEFK